tara:strand:+ start:6349 stop:6501 length:153 start_codon:yes stop_codon:yes gene_type:complete
MIASDGHAEVKMRCIQSERMALTNATLYKRGAPYTTFVVKNGSGREIHRF